MNKPPYKVRKALENNGYKVSSDGWSMFRGGDFWAYGTWRLDIYPYTTKNVMFVTARYTGMMHVEVLENLQTLEINIP